MTKWIKKKDTHICCLQEPHFRSKDIHRLKVRGGKQQKAGAPVLISNRTDFKTKIVTREGHYIMVT